MKKLFGYDLEDEYFDFLFCEQTKGKEIVVENGKVVARIKVVTEEELNQNKILELDNWFKTQYREYNEMLTRRKELGIEDTIVDEFRNKTYHNLIELYEEAEVVAKEIRELRKNNSAKI